MFDLAVDALADRGTLIVIGMMSSYADGWKPSSHAGLAEKCAGRWGWGRRRRPRVVAMREQAGGERHVQTARMRRPPSTHAHTKTRAQAAVEERQRHRILPAALRAALGVRAAG